MAIKNRLDWKVIKKYGQRAGKELMALAEASYLTMQDPAVSYRDKSIIVAALIYFISPLDALPDFLPGGFSDDVTVMLTALLSAGKVGRIHLRECRAKYGVSSRPEEENDFKEAPKKPKK